MNVRRRILALLAVIACGLPAMPAQTPAPALSFAVATVKPSHSDGWRMNQTLDGFSARGVTLRMMVQEAYGSYESDRMTGGPAWIDTSRFDAEAKMDDADTAAYRALTMEQRRAMLQTMLAERFKLRVHRVSKEFPAFALVVAAGGPKFGSARPEQSATQMGVQGYNGSIKQFRPGLASVEGFSMEQFASMLSEGGFSNELHRKVVDRTGLTGRYNFALRYTPEIPLPGATDFSGPGLIPALKGELGLKLEPTKVVLDVIVIDHAELPTEN